MFPDPHLSAHLLTISDARSPYSPPHATRKRPKELWDRGREGKEVKGEGRKRDEGGGRERRGCARREREVEGDEG